MNEHLSKLIGHYRQSKNLNFPELAKLCDLNPQKWANKICNFEREGIFDSDELVHNLIRVLEINPQEVRDAVRKDRGGSVSLDNRKRFLSGKLLVHAATWVGGKVLQ